MPRDERKHQKALMKKRSKQKAASSHRLPQETIMPLSKQTIISRARSYPIEECLISSDWERGSGLVQIVLARKQPDGAICYGVYLVDKYCLGLKNTFANAGFSRTRYEDEISGRIFKKVEAMTCPLELAHQMIYESIDYAAQFGFEPQADFATSQFLLAPRGELKEPYKLTFGQNGKPFFVAGPRDNALRIIKQLEKTAGPGNFDYFAPMSGF